MESLTLIFLSSHLLRIPGLIIQWGMGYDWPRWNMVHTGYVTCQSDHWWVWRCGNYPTAWHSLILEHATFHDMPINKQWCPLSNVDVLSICVCLRQVLYRNPDMEYQVRPLIISGPIFNFTAWIWDHLVSGCLKLMGFYNLHLLMCYFNLPTYNLGWWRYLCTLHLTSNFSELRQKPSLKLSKLFYYSLSIHTGSLQHRTLTREVVMEPSWPLAVLEYANGCYFILFYFSICLSK